MILFLTCIDKETQFRDFFCTINNMETGFDVLSSLSSSGEQIIKAEIIDQGERIQLPPEAFDGDLFSAPIQKLQSEWTAILSPPAVKANQEILDLFQKQIQNHEANIAQCKHMIGFLEISLENVKLINCSESKRRLLITRYESSLTKYHRYLDKLTVSRQYVLDRFSQLEAVWLLNPVYIGNY